MTFLAPLFLLGALAVALPVVFHLIRRTTRERTVFSSLMFLLPSPPRLTRRSRLEHLLLLLLRCAVLCLLALGFARPFLKRPSNPPEPAVARRLLLLVDTSASMRRADLWTDARDRVGSFLRKTSPADQVALFTFDRRVTPLVTFEQWNSSPAGERVALALGKLGGVSPGWSATHLGSALIAAAETLADNGGKPAPARGQIILFSDLQEGSHLEPLQGYEWPRDIKVSVETLKARHLSNASLQLVADSEETDAKAAPVVRVRVSNAPDSRREQLKVGWAHPDGRTFLGAPLDIYVPPGQSRIVQVPVEAGFQPASGAPSPPPVPFGLDTTSAGGKPASTGTHPDRIILQGDEEDFDNTIFVVPPETTRLKVLYFGSDSQKDTKQPLYFLERAFQETWHQAVQLVVQLPRAPSPPGDLHAASLFVATEQLPDELARALHAEIIAGKSLLFLVKTEAAASTLAALLGLQQVTAAEVRPGNYAMLAEIDFRHPVFAPFADPRFSDFTKIHFWQYRRLDPASFPEARTLAKFDTGDPALLEVPVGRGRVWVLTSGWQPDDSQLALSTKFVPLLYSLLEETGAPAPAPIQYHVGDVVPLAGSSGRPLTIQLPDGSPLTLAAGETNFSKTLTPGIYTVGPAITGARFAVNLDASESRTAPLPVDELERLGAPVAGQPTALAHETERKLSLQNAELESRQKIWRWLVVAALVVLLLETWLAGRTARRSAIQVDTAT
ncbi:MAG TPA: BatA domain-containing protein [Candidatus Binatia bacterium]|nr:BatA domain-containing protein [Candidatus Binatia bacterium]